MSVSAPAPWDAPPVVTVVIPTFRRPDIIGRAVRSVLDQTYPHVRARVFDNASGDETARVVADLAREDSRVGYMAHPENIGAAPNFGYAIAQVDTPLFVALSDDDLLLPDFVERGVAMMREHPEAWFHCAPSVVFHEMAGGVRIQAASWKPGLYEAGAASAERMLRQHFITTGVMFRREVRSTIGDFAEYPIEREFVARGAALHPFTVTNVIGGVLVVHERSFTAGVKNKRSDRRRNVGVGYARDCFLSAMEHVVSIPSFDATERERILEAVLANARRDTLYHLLFKALPDGAWEELDEVLLVSKSYGFGAAVRLALRVLRTIGRVPILSGAAARAIGIATRRITRSAYEPFESTSHRDIVDYVRTGRAPELLA